MSSRKFKVIMDGVMHEIEVEEIGKSSEEKRESGQNEPERIENRISENKVIQNKQKSADISGTGGEAIRSPLQGKVLDVRVQAGKRVKAGDLLFLIEAMKMENEILASRDGEIAEICIKQGDIVAAGDTMAVMK